MAVATLQLLAPRNPSGERQGEEGDGIDCVAFRQFAVELHTWGERDCRVNLEGRLRQEAFPDEEGRKRRGLRVHVDFVYTLDPPKDPPVVNSPAASPVPGPKPRFLRALLPKAA